MFSASTNPSISNERGAWKSANCCGIIWLNYFYYQGEKSLRKEIKEAEKNYPNVAMMLAALGSDQVHYMHDIFISEGYKVLLDGNNLQADKTANNVILYGKQINQPREITPEQQQQSVDKYARFWHFDKVAEAKQRSFG